jgi:2Fe-2S ferredoxin
MVKVIIENLNHLEITSSESNRKVIDLIHENYIDWMHACGKKGRCTTCKMIIKSGGTGLGPMTAREEYFREKGRLKEDERLTCQAKLDFGELVIRVADENKFPHLTYTD